MKTISPINGGGYVSNAFNRHLCDIGPNLAKQIDKTKVKPVASYNKTRTDETFTLVPTNEAETLNIVLQSKSKKSRDELLSL